MPEPSQTMVSGDDKGMVDAQPLTMTFLLFPGKLKFSSSVKAARASRFLDWAILMVSMYLLDEPKPIFNEPKPLLI